MANLKISPLLCQILPWKVLPRKKEVFEADEEPEDEPGHEEGQECCDEDGNLDSDDEYRGELLLLRDL